jgi:hypothetical protein
MIDYLINILNRQIKMSEVVGRQTATPVAMCRPLEG